MSDPWTPERIKALRKRLGMPSQRNLAKYLGTSQAIVSSWECGTTTPRSMSVAALDRLDQQAVEEKPTIQYDHALWAAAGQLAAAAVAFVVAFRAALRGASEAPTE